MMLPYHRQGPSDVSASETEFRLFYIGSLTYGLCASLSSFREYSYSGSGGKTYRVTVSFKPKKG